MMPTITLVIPTISRPTLARTLLSLRGQEWIPGDEVLLVGDGPQPQARALWDQFGLPGRYLEVPRTLPGNWGHTPRNAVHHLARGSHLAALDDDDVWAPGALAVIRRALAENPGRPHIFRVDLTCFGSGVLWSSSVLREGNVGTVFFVTPAGKVGRYGDRYGGDFDFIAETCARYPDPPVWRPEVICIARPPE